MDRTLRDLTDYTTSLTFANLPASTVQQAKRLWIDTLGCALGAADAPPAAIARRLAAASSQRSVPVIAGGAADAEWAAFVDGVLIRYLDYNDFYQAPGAKASGHPSDTFAAALPATLLGSRDGRDLILAGVLGWEVYARIGDAVTKRVLDGGAYAAVAAACITSKMLRLDTEATAHAIALSAVANVSVRQSRHGAVSMWKSCAAPYACKGGMEAALLAKDGMTGPREPFEGRAGVFELSTGRHDLLRPFGGSSAQAPFQIHQSSIKRFPIGSIAQTAIECALALRARVASPADVAAVNVTTFGEALAMMASPEKWRPQSRETADHSMPFGLAIALLHGTIELEHFSDRYLRDPDVLAMADKVNVAASDELTALYPEQRRSIVELVTRSGERFTEQRGYHRGHPKDPMTDLEIETKFRSLAEPRLGKARADLLLELLWRLDEVRDVGEVVALTESSAALSPRSPREGQPTRTDRPR